MLGVVRRNMIDRNLEHQGSKPCRGMEGYASWQGHSGDDCQAIVDMPHFLINVCLYWNGEWGSTHSLGLFPHFGTLVDWNLAYFISEGSHTYL